MIGAAPTEQTAKKIPLSLSRLSPAKDISGRQIVVEDKSRHRGGELNLPKDIPPNSYVLVLFDSVTGERETSEYRVSRNLEGEIELDSKGIPQVAGLMVNDKIPVSSKRDPSAISAGDDLNFSATDDKTFCLSLCLPFSKNLTGGEVVVITPKMLANYKKSLGL